MMEMLKRSNSNQLKRHTSATLINRTGSNFEHVISPPHSRVTNINISSPNHKTIIEKLFKGHDLVSLKKVSAKVQLRNRKNILGQTEERIFSQVIGLVGQIDELKDKIFATQQQIRQLQIEHPDIEEKVYFHGYDQKLTKEQCMQVEEENQRLMILIKETQEKQVHGLEDVLRIQRQKYEDLKRELAEDKPKDSKDLEEKTKVLKEAIQGLQFERKSQLHTSFPEFQQLRLQNEVLRQKTLKNLLQGRHEAQEARELEKYLHRDEINKQEFMHQLQNWKEQYKRIRNENQALKVKLAKREKIESKQNFNVNILHLSKASSGKGLQLQSQIKKKRNDRLNEYSSIIKRMQSLKR